MNRNKLNGFLIYSLLLIMISGLSGHPAGKQARETHAIIERDTIQTRNFVPVINHHAMIVNLTDNSMTVDIHSPLPPGKYIRGSSLAAFGKDSLLGAPMSAPFTVPIKDYIILEKPKMKKNGKTVTYCWNNVDIPAGNAVLAQYDNYYGPAEDFFRSDGMEIAGLRITGDYSVKKLGKLYRFKLLFKLKNTGNQDIDEVFFRFFLPNALALDDYDDLVSLVEPDEIWSSEDLSVNISTITDGLGNAAKGIDSTKEIGTLKAGEEVQYLLQVDVKKKAETGDIYPIFTILGRRKLTRLWPATVISGSALKGAKKFHYLFYNLVIPDSRIFKLKKDGIVVMPAGRPVARAT